MKLSRKPAHRAPRKSRHYSGSAFGNNKNMPGGRYSRRRISVLTGIADLLKVPRPALTKEEKHEQRSGFFGFLKQMFQRRFQAGRGEQT
ncbi:MAG TPA: hypothetical protein VNK82_03610 [Terriglobales bacterium]|nr:hypothetical protein [Terriglobales bacterium]